MQENLTPILSVENLCKSVMLVDGQTLHILQDIEFSVARGETIAVVGASGSGKSTLLGLLAGLDIPTSGKVCVNGTSMFELGEDGRAAIRGALIGFVFQSFQLLPAFTALENVMMPLELAGREHAAQTARTWLERVGLEQRQSHYPKHLSGGEQQRVALARAFAMQPVILLADEPTGNLDVETGNRVEDLMFELNRESEVTLLLVTHDEKLAAKCNRRIRLVAGRMIES